MIRAGQFDRDLGAMVRDPENADKTATEILSIHEQVVHNKLYSCDCSSRLKYLTGLTAAGVLTALGVLLWPH